MTGPPSPPNPKLKVVDEQARLQGTIRLLPLLTATRLLIGLRSSSLLIAPRPLIIGLRTLSGRYEMVKPESNKTGNARLLCDIAVFPVASVKVIVESATIKSV